MFEKWLEKSLKILAVGLNKSLKMLSVGLNAYLSPVTPTVPGAL
jgi:hypothetical protein